MGLDVLFDVLSANEFVVRDGDHLCHIEALVLSSIFDLMTAFNASDEVS